MDKFSGTLQKYGLFTFHKRLLDRLLIFAHSILNYENSPPKLKEIIKLPDNSTNYTEIDQYNFRQGAKAKNIIPLTKYEHLSFHFFFPRLIFSKT